MPGFDNHVKPDLRGHRSEVDDVLLAVA